MKDTVKMISERLKPSMRKLFEMRLRQAVRKKLREMRAQQIKS